MIRFERLEGRALLSVVTVNTPVVLQPTSVNSQAEWASISPQGAISLTQAPLALTAGGSRAGGSRYLDLVMTDVAGSSAGGMQTFTRAETTTTVDAVLTWNQIALEAIRRDATNPPIATRGLAIMSAAVFDAVSAVNGTPPLFISQRVGRSVSIDAAVIGASYRVLSYLYPAQRSILDAALEESLDTVPDGCPEILGFALGRYIAARIIALRANDGWNRSVAYVPGTDPGDWRPTPPDYEPALLPHWGQVRPFVLNSGSQFRPAGPPDLSSPEYAVDFQEVQLLGRSTGSTRTAEQTEIAHFWADDLGTYTPPGHWNQIAAEVAQQQGLDLVANARLFAQLNLGLADAGIAVWDSKYAENFWRPITAITLADTDGNPATAANESWTPLLDTPPFPEYASGHSTFSGTAARILSSVFGDQFAFSNESVGLPGVRRSFSSFQQAAEEAGRSRIYGGIHYEFSNRDGLSLGEQIAQAVLNRFNVISVPQPPSILLGASSEENLPRQSPTLSGSFVDPLPGMASSNPQRDKLSSTTISTAVDGVTEIGSASQRQQSVSRPIDTSTLNSSTIFAANTTGTPVPATIISAQGETFAHPLSEAPAVALHVDGATIVTGDNHQLLDTNGNGHHGGSMTTSLAMPSLAPLLSIPVSDKALDPHPDLPFLPSDDIRAGTDSILLTSNEGDPPPLRNVDVLILGLEDQALFPDIHETVHSLTASVANIKRARDRRPVSHAPPTLDVPKRLIDLQFDVDRTGSVLGARKTAEQ